MINIKKVIIIILIIGLILIGYLRIIYIPARVVKKEINKINTIVTDGYANLAKYRYPSAGEVIVTAKYRGPHGESIPKETTYDFRLNEDNEALANLSYILASEEGYSQADIAIADLMAIYNRIKVINQKQLSSLLKGVDYQVKANSINISLDVNQINKGLKTNFQAGRMQIKTSGIFRQPESIKIWLDDLLININDNKISLEYQQNQLNLAINSRSYFLNINDNLKISLFITETENLYNIVVNEQLLSLEARKEQLSIKASTPISIYTGMDLTITFPNIEANSETQKLLENNPVVEYFGNMNFEFWRKNK